MNISYYFNTSRVLALGLICIFLVSSACATKPDKASLDSGEYIDGVIRDMVQPDQPGIAVLISRGDRVLLSKGYGLADMEQEIPITSKTIFRIGSITKQFTAASILKLQEEGKLKVTDRLTKYIPDYPRGDEVTLHHLLTHTSGIENYTGKLDFSGKVTQVISSNELIDSFKYDDFNFKPGDSYSYSNSGYFLLGYIVERVSGKSYEKYLQETFFKPLGMNDSGVHHADLKLANEALGYSNIEGETVNALNWDMSHAGAAGAIYSTVEDLNRWNEGIFNGQVLSQESLAAAFTGAKIRTSDQLTGYGYGWGIGEQGGLKLMHHSGGLDGFTSYLVRFPQQDLTIAVLHNSRPVSGDLYPGQIAKKIARVYLRQDMAAPVDTSKKAHIVDKTVNPESYLAFEGHYYYGPLKVLEVTTEDNRLFAQLSGQKKFEIFPESPTKYFWKVVDAQAEFLYDSNGEVIALRHTQNGRSFMASLLEETAIVEVAPDILDNYVGVYKFDNIGKLIITRKSDFLVVQVPPKYGFPQDRLEVYGKSDTIFFSPLIQKIEIEFVKNDADIVESAVIHQGGSRFSGVRIE